MSEPDLEREEPREIPSPCPRCGHQRPLLNGAHYAAMRRAAKLTLADMARVCDVSQDHLSRMERGERTFHHKYADLYMRLLDRRKRCGDDEDDADDE